MPTPKAILSLFEVSPAPSLVSEVGVDDAVGVVLEDVVNTGDGGGDVEEGEEGVVTNVEEEDVETIGVVVDETGVSDASSQFPALLNSAGVIFIA